MPCLWMQEVGLWPAAVCPVPLALSKRGMSARVMVPFCFLSNFSPGQLSAIKLLSISVLREMIFQVTVPHRPSVEMDDLWEEGPLFPAFVPWLLPGWFLSSLVWGFSNTGLEFQAVCHPWNLFNQCRIKRNLFQEENLPLAQFLPLMWPPWLFYEPEGLAKLLAFMPSFLMIPGNGPHSKDKTIGISKKQQSWRGLMSLSLFQVGLWKQCLLEAPFCRPHEAQKSEGGFLPCFAVYTSFPRCEKEEIHYIYKAKWRTFQAAGCELYLSLRHFHSASVAPKLSTERKLSPRKSDPFSMYHYQNYD